ncbi:MAG: hypothetical protein K2I35_06085, partial [Duncaniella sp.]|nr:hypothetical protein [Duncaniella sp.]
RKRGGSVRCGQETDIIEWNGIEYGNGGNVKAVALDDNGKPVAEHTIRTAGRPVALHVTAGKSVLDADGNDLMYLDVTAVDGKGNIVPDYSGKLTVTVEGEGSLLALDDADHYTGLLFNGINTKNMKDGRMQVIIRATENPGTVKVRLTTPQFRKIHTFTTR